MKLSILIPAYNEERRLGPTLDSIRRFLGKKRLQAEVLVIDDGSSDGTAALVRRTARRFKGLRLVSQKHNQGKGAAIARGAALAKGEWVLFTDADLSTPIEELDRFLKRGRRADVVVGSRALAQSKILKRQPLYRHLGGKAFNLAVRLVTLGGFSDTQCGFKMFRRQVGRKLFALQRVPGFGFDVEFLYLAVKFGYRCEEIPVRWVNSAETKVSLGAAMMTFTDLIKIRLLDWSGAYKGHS